MDSEPRDHTILIVDDDADIREVLTLVLDLDGRPVIEASDGIEALARIRQTSGIALVLLDLMMPNMNGADVLRVMKHDPQLASIPVLLLSGDRHAQDIAEELGADGCLGKPVDLPVLLREVHRFVDP
jgi:chemosensory pili system protein ChpA (sensor histidine kinase/response regulator)